MTDPGYRRERKNNKKMSLTAENLLNPELMAQLERLELVSRKILRVTSSNRSSCARSSGVRISAFFGFGVAGATVDIGREGLVVGVRG